ncbi:aspartate--tRNA ligase [Tautonia sociabilis]|uniref:Aspartate--tRNA(Asp/Asn) ligase n=1 Tax=Tautonia sociabilis TaxID=2080755 RepID=A0A432MM35_9BACT|nr:aspartate--tRNA ligase [Tautonia sociabilis]RUL88472.1 aspartate--tRNA ligase [Tautonia sociabilis]
MLKRTHSCGELTAEHLGREVVLNGWVNAYRDFGGVVFIDLRDRAGLTQVVFEPEAGTQLQEAAQSLRNEWVIGVRGTVRRRLPGKENPKLQTGEIELQATELEVFNATQTPPFEIDGEANEELRLKYRFLDLRRPEMHRIVEIRHRLAQTMRRTMTELGFWEVETPILGRSTPEGARDFLVPSRIHPGHFYALPQSPQLYKQLLMVAGMDRYFQIARCFRDEDLRANRQPEFTQLDIEMSFVQFEDVLATMEGLVKALSREFTGEELSTPLPRLDYHEAMERFGTDRPDLRFGMELIDLGDLAAQTEFKVFKDTIEHGRRVRGICAPGAAEKYSRKDLDALTSFAGDYGAKGLVWLKVEAEQFTGPTAKFLSPEVQAAFRERFGAKPGDLLLIVADTKDVTSAALSALRHRLGRELKLYDPKSFHYSWVVRFPLFSWDAEEGRYVAEHHPFTMPLPEDLHLLESEPLKVRAQAYDLVINGEEAAGGTIRCHDPAIQSTIFRHLGLSPEEAEEKFGFLLSALRFGAPPHGGIAFGLDRMVMLYAGLDNIRDVIPFPKTAKGTDLMTGAPGTVEEKQLRELHIRQR